MILVCRFFGLACATLTHTIAGLCRTGYRILSAGLAPFIGSKCICFVLFNNWSSILEQEFTT